MNDDWQPIDTLPADDLNARVVGLVRCWEARRRTQHESIALDLADDLACDVPEDVAWRRYERRCKAHGIGVRRPKPTLGAAMFWLSAGFVGGYLGSLLGSMTWGWP